MQEKQQKNTRSATKKRSGQAGKEDNRQQEDASFVTISETSLQITQIWQETECGRECWTDNEKQNNSEDGKYHPGRLSKREWDIESEERRRRKTNVVVRGLQYAGRQVGAELEKALQAQTGVCPAIKRWKWIEKGILVELSTG